jgi:hypothetical protein
MDIFQGILAPKKKASYFYELNYKNIDSIN